MVIHGLTYMDGMLHLYKDEQDGVPREELKAMVGLLKSMFRENISIIERGTASALLLAITKPGYSGSVAASSVVAVAIASGHVKAAGPPPVLRILEEHPAHAEILFSFILL